MNRTTSSELGRKMANTPSIANGLLIASVAFKFLALIVGVLGNVVVIIFQIFMNSESTATSYLISNLAVTDGLVCLIFYPIWIVEFLLTLSEVESDQTLFCKLSRSISLALLFVSITTLVGITIDRYIFIVKPLKYPIIVTKRRVVMLIKGTWATALGILIIFACITEKDEMSRRSFCDLPGPVIWSFKILFVYIPIISIIVLNFRILIVAREHRMRILAEIARASSLERSKDSHKPSAEFEQLRALKAVKTFLIIVFVLAFCCIIPQVIGITLSRGIKTPFYYKWYTVFHYELYGINSIVNAFIYGMRHSKYRKAYARILSKVWSCGCRKTAEKTCECRHVDV